MTKIRQFLVDFLLLFCFSAVLIGPWFRAQYLQLWPSIESTFIADGRFLAAHWPHPLWQPLWYCGTRFDYIYPPVLRYGTALLTNLFIPVQAYHVFTGLMFCLGIAGVGFLVRVMSGSRLQGWLSAVASAMISPSFLFLADVRHDSPYLMPQRLGVLVRYGEGPHISSLSLLPFALAFAWLGLRRGRNGSLALAAVFSALVVLTNFYGATALAILFPVLVWSAWIASRDRAVWLRALAIAALAYALTAFWLTPSYFRITLYNLRYVSQPGSPYSILFAIVAAGLFGVASVTWGRGKPYPVFVTGSLLFMGLNVLGNFYFNFRILGEPIRLIPELDMTIILFAVAALTHVWMRPFATPMTVRSARAVVILIALAALLPERHFIRRAWTLYPNEPDFHTRVEYRVSGWLSQNLPDARTFTTGSTRFWWDAWHDVAEVGGGSDQGLINPNPPAAAWELTLGPDPEPSVLWLQALGADTVVVADAHSGDAYHDFKYPSKFAAVLPVLFDDQQGNVVYRVPRRFPGLARVVERAQLAALPPGQPAANPALIRAYRDLVEQGPDIPATSHWNSTESLAVHAGVGAGQSILVQETYDPAWRAYAGRTELPVRPDAMDFMVIDAPPGTHDIVLVFTTPLGNRIGYVLSGLAFLLCFCLGMVSLRKASRLTDGSGYPWYFGALRALLRRINRNMPPWPVPADSTNFDPERLRRAETALRAMKMPDEQGDRYLAKHIPRLSRTLALVPRPQTTGRVLELGCYMQITPLLERVCGYREVRGAYYGQAEKIDRKTLDFPDGQFACYVDHFDVERDRFPYPDASFDLVIAGEIIEHMTYDPMRMLLESRRVLIEGGYLLISTPNVGSVTSAAKALEGRDNPQIFFLYERPGPDQRTDIGHVREYTLYELGEMVKAAGFEIESLFTTFIEEFSEHRQLLRFLALNDFGTENRGEQSWCVARKRGSLPVDRYPWFIYTP